MTRVRSNGVHFSAGFDHDPALIAVTDHDAVEGAGPVVDSYVLAVELRGTRELAVRYEGGREQRVSSAPGGVTGTPAGVHAVWRPAEPVRVLSIVLPPSLIREACDAVHGPAAHHVLAGRLSEPFVAEHDPVIERLSLALASEGERALPGSELFVDSIARAIAVALARRWPHGRARVESVHETRAMHGLSRVQQRRVLELLDARLSERLSVADLANAANVSAFHFTRLFRLSFGTSPWRYVTERRVERARHLLATERETTISRIAADSGFASAAHLATAMRAAIGMSPREYRLHAATTRQSAIALRPQSTSSGD